LGHGVGLTAHCQYANAAHHQLFLQAGPDINALPPDAQIYDAAAKAGVWGTMAVESTVVKGAAIKAAEMVCEKSLEKSSGSGKC
jgi:hypothetical protein